MQANQNKAGVILHPALFLLVWHKTLFVLVYGMKLVDVVAKFLELSSSACVKFVLIYEFSIVLQPVEQGVLLNVMA